MLGNMDLIVVALIHGLFIASLLLATVFLLLTLLLLALAAALFAIPAMDLHDAVSLLSRSRLVNSLQANFHLASLLVVCFLLSRAIPLLDDSSASTSTTTPLFGIVESSGRRRGVSRRPDDLVVDNRRDGLTSRSVSIRDRPPSFSF